jgi:chromosome segregation ATPase
LTESLKVAVASLPDGKIVAAFHSAFDAFSDVTKKNADLAERVREISGQLNEVIGKAKFIIKQTQDDRLVMTDLNLEYKNVEKLIQCTVSEEERARGIVSGMHQGFDQLKEEIVFRMDEGETAAQLKAEVDQLKSELETLAHEARVTTRQLRDEHRAEGLAQRELELVTANEEKMNADERATDQRFAAVSRERQVAEAGLRRMNDDVELSRKVIGEGVTALATARDKIEDARHRFRETRDVASEERANLGRSRVQGRGLGQKLDRAIAALAQLDRKVGLVSAVSAAKVPQIQFLERSVRGVDRETAAARAVVAERIAAMDRCEREARVEEKLLDERRDDAQKVQQQDVIVRNECHAAARERGRLTNALERAERERIEEARETHHARGFVASAVQQIRTVKGENDRAKSRIALIERQGQKQGLKSAKMQQQAQRVNEVVARTRLRNTEAGSELDRLEKGVADVVERSKGTRLERDRLQRKVAGIVYENEVTEGRVIELEETVAKDAIRLEEATVSVISTHFGTREVEEQIQGIEAVESRARDVIAASTRQLAIMRSERNRLLRILDQGRDEIAAIRDENGAIATLAEVVQREISGKEKTVRQLTAILLSKQNEVRRGAELYGRELQGISDLEWEASSVREAMQRRLQGAERVYVLKGRIARLDNALRAQMVSRGRFVDEGEVPRLIHRWAISEVMDPEQFRRIRYLDRLRGRFAAAAAELEELKAEKAGVNVKLAELRRFPSPGKIQKAIRRAQEEYAERVAKIRAIEDRMRESTDEIPQWHQRTESLRLVLVDERRAACSVRGAHSLSSRAAPSSRRSRLGGGFQAISRTFYTQPLIDVFSDEEEEPESPRRRFDAAARAGRPSTSRASRKVTVRAQNDAAMKVATARPVTQLARRPRAPRTSRTSNRRPPP